MPTRLQDLGYPVFWNELKRKRFIVLERKTMMSPLGSISCPERKLVCETETLVQICLMGETMSSTGVPDKELQVFSVISWMPKNSWNSPNACKMERNLAMWARSPFTNLGVHGAGPVQIRLQYSLLCVCFFIWKMGVVIVSTSQSGCED